MYSLIYKNLELYINIIGKEVSKKIYQKNMLIFK